MAIPKTDIFQNQLENLVLTVGGTLTGTIQISGLRAGLLDVQLEVTTPLDQNVELTILEGNIEDITKMTPLIDTRANQVVDEILTTENNYIIKAKTEMIYIGFSLDVLTATSGAITLTARA